MLRHWVKLEVIDDEMQELVADFGNWWLKTSINVGRVVLFREGIKEGKDERWREEFIFSVLGLTYKEFRATMRTWTGVIPFHSQRISAGRVTT